MLKKTVKIIDAMELIEIEQSIERNRTNPHLGRFNLALAKHEDKINSLKIETKDYPYELVYKPFKGVEIT